MMKQLLALLVAASATVSGQNASPASPRPQEQAPQAKQEGYRPEPIVTATAAQNQPLADPQAPSAPKESNNWHNWFWPPDWSDWATVLVGAVGIRLALRTLKTMEEQTKASVMTARTAADEYLVSAAAARLAESALHKTERADFQFEEIFLIKGLPINEDSIIRFVFKNQGWA